MKNLLIVLVIFYFQNQVFGQTEFAPEGAEWCYYFYGGAVAQDGYFHLKYIGDTVMLSKNVKVLHGKWSDSNSGGSYFYFYQSNDSIYMAGMNKFEYVFRNQGTIGETMHFFHAGDVKVENAEGIPFGNTSINKYIIEWSGYPNYTELYDRAGPAFSFIDIWNAPAFDGYRFNLRWYKDNEVPFFKVSEGQCEDLFTSNEEILQSEFSIFPNPTKNLLYLKLPFDLERTFNARIFDLTGRLIKDDKATNGEINVSQLTAGMYVLWLETEGKIYKEKFIKN